MKKRFRYFRNPFLIVLSITIVFFIILFINFAFAQLESDYNAEGYIIEKELENEGYIIELQDNPLIIKEKELEKLANENENKISSMSNLNPIKYGYMLFATRKGDIPKKLSDHKNKLKRDRDGIKNKIKNQLGKKNIQFVTGNAISDPEVLNVITEYENVFNGFSIDITDEEAEKIMGLDGIKSVSPNFIVNVSLFYTVPYLIQANYSWSLGYTGEGISIAIIDTGIDYTHPDLGNCNSQEFLAKTCSKVIEGYDFINNDNDPMDDNGHGTHVAGIAASSGGGGLKGVAPDAKLYAYKVLNAGGSGSFAQVIAGVERAVDPNKDGNFSDHVDIMSLSLGAFCGNYSMGCGPDDSLSRAIDNAVDAGVVAVIAAGNSGWKAGTIATPGTARKAITVGSAGKGDVIELYSSRGPVVWNNEIIIKPDIIAPGGTVCAAEWHNTLNTPKCFSDKYVTLSGTSMATPHVAGAAALLKQKHPSWSPREIKTVLRSKTINLKFQQYVDYDIETQGYGRLMVPKAIDFQGVPSIAEIKTSGKVGGSYINIIGSAEGKEFRNYRLYYGKGEILTFYGKGKIPAQWIELINSNLPVTNGILYQNFNISSVGQKDIYLKLDVFNNNGEIIRDESRVEYTCGNSICESGESQQNCPTDCCGQEVCYSCADTDGDFYPPMKGSVYGVEKGQNYSFGDFCSSETTLTEYSCSGTFLQSKPYVCGGSFTGCSDGACTGGDYSYHIIKIQRSGFARTGASDINLIGQVAGIGTTPPEPCKEPYRYNLMCQYSHPFLWENGAIKDLDKPTDYYVIDLNGINDKGQVIGYASTLFLFGNWQFGLQSFLWENGGATRLPNGVFNETSVYGINNKGQIVGEVVNGEGMRKAVLWENGSMYDLEKLPQATQSYARDINNKGQIVGLAIFNDGGIRKEGVLWENGDAISLGGIASWAAAINDKGQIVGSSSLLPIGDYDFKQLPVLWKDGSIIYLSTEMGEAHDINNKGQIVGVVSYKAVLWENEVMKDLSALLPPSNVWTLYSASGINDNGWIVGKGRQLNDNKDSGFLLIPVSDNLVIIRDEVKNITPYSAVIEIETSELSNLTVSIIFGNSNIVKNDDISSYNHSFFIDGLNSSTKYTYSAVITYGKGIKKYYQGRNTFYTRTTSKIPELPTSIYGKVITTDGVPVDDIKVIAKWIDIDDNSYYSETKSLNVNEASALGNNSLVGYFMFNKGEIRAKAGTKIEVSAPMDVSEPDPYAFANPGGGAVETNLPILISGALPEITIISPESKEYRAYSSLELPFLKYNVSKVLKESSFTLNNGTPVNILNMENIDVQIKPLAGPNVLNVTIIDITNLKASKSIEFTVSDVISPNVSLNEAVYGLDIIKLSADVVDDLGLLGNSCKVCISSDGLCDSEWIAASNEFEDDNLRGRCFYEINKAAYNEGDFIFNFEVSDLSNNFGKGLQKRVSIDKTPPTEVSGFKVQTVIGENALGLSWSSSIDTQFLEYRIYRISSQERLVKTIPNKTTTSFKDVGLESQKTYTYRISVVDKSLNENQGVSAAGTVADTVMPIIDITSPQDRAYNFTNISLIYTVSEEANCSYNLNGVVKPISSFILAKEGQNTIIVSCSDGYNTGNSSVSFIVDTIPPAPISSLSVEQVDTRLEFNLAWNKSSTADRYFVYRDINNFSSLADKAPIATTTYTDFIDKNNLQERMRYYYAVIPGDSAGNINYNYFIVRDGVLITPLIIDITSPLNDTYYNSPDIILRYSASKPVVSCTYTLNGISREFSDAIRAQEGVNTLFIECVDANNIIVRSNDIVFYVDTATPEKIGGLIMAQAQNGNTIELTWDSYVGSDFLNYNIYRSESAFSDVSFMAPIAKKTSNSFSDVNLPEGVYYYAVTVVDKALNEDKNVNSVEVNITKNDVSKPFVNVRDVGKEVYGIINLTADVSDDKGLKQSCLVCISSDGICDSEWVSAINNFINGQLMGKCSYVWDTAQYQKINYTYNFRISDLSDNLGEGTAKQVLVLETPVNNDCSDGTLNNQCSLTKPKYCENKILIDKCSLCGCNAGSYCNNVTNLCSEIPKTSYRINLYSGWNLFSVSWQLPDMSIGSVLSNISGKYRAVYSYDALTRNWIIYQKNQSLFDQSNSLINFEIGKAYWIDMFESADLDIEGTNISNYKINLIPGWNFVGYPYSYEKSVGEALKTLNNNYDIIYGFDNQNKKWILYSPYSSGIYNNTLNKLGPGKGYWIYVYEGSMWQP